MRLSMYFLVMIGICGALMIGCSDVPKYTVGTKVVVIHGFDVGCTGLLAAYDGDFGNNCNRRGGAYYLYGWKCVVNGKEFVELNHKLVEICGDDLQAQ